MPKVTLELTETQARDLEQLTKAIVHDGVRSILVERLYYSHHPTTDIRAALEALGRGLRGEQQEPLAPFNPLGGGWVYPRKF